ncbi:MAG: exodeoxyribonuclease V subunit gamma [Gammaproteobacteria bacterium]|nr:exodeoxyribonuclease V subunit gamma [Gammaproteobacteria bacterium]
MLRIVSSNRQEALLDALSERLRVPADDNPLAPELIVAERGIDTWLLQQLAERRDVAANIEFRLPGTFVWQALAALVPDVPKQSRFDAAPLTWRLMRLLPGLLDQPDFQTIAGYLDDDADGRKRYQLCARIAAAFNDYLVYRPRMILGWEKGRATTDSPDEIWQLRLWEAVTAEIGHDHRARLLERFAALSDETVAAAALPRRVSVFGVPALPPVYVEALAKLAQGRDVDLYVLNPSEEFWGDLVDPRQLSSDPAGLAYAHDLPNRLLASWGQPVRFFLSGLYGHSAEYVDAWGGPAQPATLLQRIQADVRELTETTGWAPDAEDQSLRVASAWGPMREVEALHDWLLDRFQRDRTLKPRDVAVLLPDVERYAPYVQAVFGAAEGTPRHLPWTLADVPPRATFPVLGAVEQLLRLPESRFTVSEVVGLLEVPAVARRFELDDAALSALRGALRAVHAHWGLDAAMRAQILGVAAEAAGSAHTWETALRRLFLGVAMPEQDAPVHGVAPAPLFEGQAAAALGRLASLVERLAHWHAALVAARPPTAWVRAVHALVEALLEPASADDEQALEALSAALGAFDREAGEGGFEAPLTLAVFRDDLLGRLGAPDGRGRFLDGRVAVAALTPMRSLPFRLIAVLGLNGDAFPRAHAAAGFDLVAQAPAAGDRSRRLDDRHLFLETLLSAREALYLSYTGRQARDGSEAQPSVVVSELLDCVVAMQGGEPARDAVLGRLVVEHPLQPFSRRYFEGDPAQDGPLYTYDGDWVVPAREAAGLRAGRPPFCAGPLPEREGDATADLPLESLSRCLAQPTAFFLRERLGVDLRNDEETLSDDEPFALDGLQAYALKTEWLEHRLAGRDAAAQRALVCARGDLPVGAFGELAWQTVADAVEPLADSLAPQLAGARALPVDLQVAGRRVTGTLRGVTPRGLVRYTVASFKPKYLLGAWVSHLALLATAPPDTGPQTRLVTGDETWVLGPVADPLGELAALVRIRDEALREPLPFFPETSWCWAKHAAEPEKARSAAWRAWQPNEYAERRAESEEAANRIAWGHRPDPFGPRFEALAEAVYRPLLAAARLEDGS